MKPSIFNPVDGTQDDYVGRRLWWPPDCMTPCNINKNNTLSLYSINITALLA